MEALINKKRKKRRTRKCLDAIRKKARQTLSDNGSNKSGDVKINNKYITSKSSITLTNDRLTLLKKTVRSETVSRSLISHIKDDKANAVNKLILPLKEKVMNNEFPNNFCDGLIKNRTDKKSHFENFIEVSNHKTQNTIILFSPLQKPESSSSSEKYEINNFPTHQESLGSASSVNNSYCENFYDNFMNEIPNYLKQKASEFFKTDIVYKYKLLIRNFFLENNHLKIEDSVHLKEDESNDSSEYEGYSHHLVVNSKSMSISQDSMECRSSNEESISPLYSIVSNSPEYTYYPHKLYQ